MWERLDRTISTAEWVDLFPVTKGANLIVCNF